jgi:FkbM family methyltransferase
MVLALVQRVAAAVPALRRVKRRPVVRRTASALRYGACVRETLRLAAREVRSTPGVHTYRLAGTDLTVAMRHNGHDAWVLHEVFGDRCYEPPAEVAAALRSGRGPLRVVDLGGHLGLFGLFVLSRFPDADITAFEPDPANARILRETIASNGRAASWRVHEAAACPYDGSVRFAAGLAERSHVTAAHEPGGVDVRAIDVFAHLADPDLLKIDIEGGEWALLRDARFAAVPARAIVLEYHAFGCPGPDPRATATRILDLLGYAVRWAPEASLNDAVGMLWAWRPEEPRRRARAWRDPPARASAPPPASAGRGA